MITMLRMTVLFVAMLLLAHGLITADSNPVVSVHSVVELERVIIHDPVAMHAAHGGKQCHETGCTVAASQGQFAAIPMLIPDLPAAKPYTAAVRYTVPTEHRLAGLSAAPPVPPPESSLFETMGGFSA